MGIGSHRGRRPVLVRCAGKEASAVAVWQCSRCGFEKDARCKPKKCPECGEKDTFGKKEAGAAKGKK